MRRLLLAAPVLALVLGVAACAGAGDSGIATAGGTVEDDGAGGEAELSQEEQAQAFVDCMREQGIDMPDPDPNGGGGGIAGFRDLDIPREELRPALEACRDQLDFGGQGGPPQLSPEQQEQRAEFTECMRENGIDVPDPDPNGGGFGLGGGDFDPNDPDFQAAIEACQDFFAGFRGGPGGPGGGQ
jgi:hypothetical protein